MSRIGKNPVTVPAGVTLTQSGQVITVKGAKGELNFTMPDSVTGKLDGAEFTVSPVEGNKNAKAMWGMARIARMEVRSLQLRCLDMYDAHDWRRHHLLGT